MCACAVYTSHSYYSRAMSIWRNRSNHKLQIKRWNYSNCYKANINVMSREFYCWSPVHAQVVLFVLPCKQKLTAVVSIVESTLCLQWWVMGLLTAMLTAMETAKNLIAPEGSHPDCTCRGCTSMHVYTLEILLLSELCIIQATTVTACKGRTDIYTHEPIA